MYVICANDFPFVIVDTDDEDEARGISDQIQRGFDNRRSTSQLSMKVYVHIHKIPVLKNMEQIKFNSGWPMVEDPVKGCAHCMTTNNLISEQFTDEKTGMILFADLRLDLENNQLDIYHGVSRFRSEDGQWTNSVNIKYCPFCGRNLEVTK